MYPGARKQLFGYEKRKRKKRDDELNKSQKGALDRFVVKKMDIHEIELNENESKKEEEKGLNVDESNREEEIGRNGDDEKEIGLHEDELNNENFDGNINENTGNPSCQEAFSTNIYDPRTWDMLDIKSRDLLAIGSLQKRFDSFTSYEKNFGFLFSSEKLNSLDEATLKANCENLDNILKHGELGDLDGQELFQELNTLRYLLPKQNNTALDILTYLKRLNSCPNAYIAYRIMLTIPVTVASAEKSFSKLKLLKSYLRSNMSQERLNGLALISIEQDLLENIDFENFISEFASKNARRSIFK